MEDFEKKYYEELNYQEIKSNKYTIKGFGVFFIAVAFIWLLTMIDFFEIDKSLMTIAFLLSAFLSIPVLYIFFKCDLSKTWIKYFLLSLICIVSGVITSFLSYHAVLVYVIPLLFAIQYRRRSTIYFVYLVNIITMLISSLISFYYGICDLNILFQSQHVRSWYLDLFEKGILDIVFNENPIFIIIVFEVFPRSIILFVFSVMMQYIIINSNEDAHRIAQLTYLKETDIKTKVFNKNKYIEMANQYYLTIENIAVIFLDLNNLKEINDRYGHAVGDTAIEKLSFVLFSYANERCRIYRIGGDEFLMIIDDPVDNEVEMIIKGVQEKLINDNVSSAIGFAIGKGEDILEVVRIADAHMYENKKEMKKQKIKDFS